MNPFTELIWEVITDSPDFLKQLTAIMQREYKPFLSGEKAFQANAHELERCIREELDKWVEWLPDNAYQPHWRWVNSRDVRFS